MYEYTAGLLHGRRVITTDVEDITPNNVLNVLQKALTIHWMNSSDIEYLWGVYRGHQKILNRTKDVRPEICNKIVINRSNEIVTFKTGFFLNEPVQYVAHSDADGLDDKIAVLNEFMFADDKDGKDHELVDWMHIAGTGYRMALPSDGKYKSVPVNSYVLDPRYTFVVYYSGLGKRPMMGVTYVTRDDGSVVYSCYTDNWFFEIVDDTVRAEPLLLSEIPIIEYPLNTARIGAFELVLPLLDAINMVDSNRVDAVEQFVQALMLFHNVDITSDDFDSLRERGALKYRDINEQMKGEIAYITAELKQGETQTLVDHMYQTVLTICGMPNRNGGLSTSDTGSAVIMRDGWSDAEARAKNTEKMFKRSEKQFLRVALNLYRYLAKLDIAVEDIDIRFPRANYENMQGKIQILTTMLARDDIHPMFAFQLCNAFPDPQQAYNMSMEYKAEQEAKELERQKELTNDGKTESAGNNRDRKAAGENGSSGTED